MTGFKPSHWPLEVQYISSQHYHTSVTASARAQISFAPISMNTLDAPRRTFVVIRLITDPSHPANRQRGLFAARKIPPRTHILDYIGEVHCDERPDSNYDLSLLRLQNGVSIGVDATRMGNEARFINDFRGVRSKSNALFEERRTAGGELRMAVWSGSQSIQKGEEILVSYGKEWWRSRFPEAQETA